MVLRASENGVLLDCPRILFVLSVTTPHSQTTEAKRKKMTIPTNQNNNDEGLSVVTDNDNMFEPQFSMYLNDVVRGPTLWNGVINGLEREIVKRGMVAKQTAFVVPYKGGSVTILFPVGCLYRISDTTTNNNHSKDMLHHYHNTMGGNRSIFPSRCRHDHLKE